MPDLVSALLKRAELSEQSQGVLPFPRSYAVSMWNLPTLPEPLESFWVREKIGPGEIAHDPILEVSTAKKDKMGVAVVGLAYDPELPNDQHHLLPGRLLDSWRNSRQRLLNHLERLNGRFVVIYWGPSGFFMQSDASSMRAIFYHGLRNVAAGNANLLAELNGERESTVYSELIRTPSKLNTYPGRRTNWANIFLLNSNLELNLHGREIRRVGPTPILEWLSAEEAAHQVTADASKFMAYLSYLPNPVNASLTAGLDTRLSLSLMKELREEPEFFTYKLTWAAAKNIADMDIDISAKLAQRFNLKHRYVTFESTRISSTLREIFERNNPRSHGQYLIPQYGNMFSPDSINVRSTIFELGRARHGIQPDISNPAEWMTRKIVNSGKPNGNIIADFNDYMQSSDYAHVPDTYLAQDIYYWEITDSSWMQHIIAESDHVFDTAVLINSRKILKTLLSVPAEERQRSMTYIHMLQQNMPDLLRFPVNGKMLVEE